MVAETIKISKFAVKRAIKRAAKSSSKRVLVKVPNQTGKVLFSMLKNAGKTMIGTGILYGVSETYKGLNRKSFEGFTDDVSMLTAKVRNSMRD